MGAASLERGSLFSGQLAKSAPLPKIKSYGGHPPNSCIEIAYRDEGNGGGAFYDHYTTQKITSRQTRLSVPTDMTISAFESYVKTQTQSLPFGVEIGEGKKFPPVAGETDRVGLLIIPGHARETETKRYAQALAPRNTHEADLLKKARNQGRPVLAICAGVWEVWESCGGLVSGVTDHAWRRMPSLNVDGSIGHNVQMHKVEILAHSMLSGALFDGSRIKSTPALLELTVNSVHWKAPNRMGAPQVSSKGLMRPIFTIAATAKQDITVAPKSKATDGAVYRLPQADTVEAIEQFSGAPILGIQWHPEAYNKFFSPCADQHRSILTFMAKAGDAFCARQRMVDSFKSHAQEIIQRLKKV